MNCDDEEDDFELCFFEDRNERFPSRGGGDTKSGFELSSSHSPLLKASKLRPLKQMFTQTKIQQTRLKF